MHGPDSSREEAVKQDPAVKQCIVQMVVWKWPLDNAWSMRSREETVIHCMVHVVGKKLLYDAWFRW